NRAVDDRDRAVRGEHAGGHGAAGDSDVGKGGGAGVLDIDAVGEVVGEGGVGEGDGSAVAVDGAVAAAVGVAGGGAAVADDGVGEGEISAGGDDDGAPIPGSGGRGGAVV